ncbi:RuBisCO large chain family protein [Skeletonema marinoi]|uniref:RuBisCO large chain family protein n=1 Tax=Skeletonema marinoi TaxID=267567 RepID=A0AAD9DGJ6_9STRA|nr:RuBisCO large chain family protein [Skeletonema marinoi]
MDSNIIPDNLQHPERFWVDYVIEATSKDHASQIAREICLEQTVELPGTTQAVRSVEAYTVGTLERIEFLGTGDELPQFLNVLFGNTSLKRGVAVEDVTLSRHLMQNSNMFPGPKFGIAGIRKLLGVPQAPLLATALKPMGRSSEDFASMAYQLAKGGIDIIKDDHGLSNQKWAPFEQRVALCCDAVQRANRETGRNCLYAPCLNAPSDQIISRAYFSKDCGAGAVMLLPGISGFDAVRQLAADPASIYPSSSILPCWRVVQSSSHRRRGSCNSQEGGETDEEDHPRGLSHKFLFGLLPRLCGGDIVIFCNSGGRFEPIFPSPAGGMKLDRVKEMRKTFGDDTVFLIGGNLLEQGPDLEADARFFLRAARRDRQYCLPRELSHTMSSTINEEELTNSKYVTQRSSDAFESDAGIPSVAFVERVASNIRRRVLKAIPGSPGPGIRSVTGESFNGDPADLKLDRLIFSPVHYAVVLYSLLVEIGRLDEKAFDDYNVDGSTVELIGAEHSPGHAVTAGSLAQALSQAAGIGYARKLKNATGRVAVYMSDGEFQEGQTWEAVQAMVNLKINLVAVVDVNGQQCDGEMKQVCNVGDLARKLRAFGAEVHQVNGHNVSEIEMAVRHRSELPSFVLCNTNPCQGIPLMKARAPKLHYVRFKDTAEKRQFEHVLASMNHKVCNSGGNSGDIISTGVTNNVLKFQSVAERKPSAAETSRGEFSKVATKVDVVNRPHRAHLLEWMKLHPTAIVVTADLTSSCEADLIRDKLPQQYLSLGMAEQNMMSFCGGLARENFTPWIHTFGVFCTRRPFDQLAMSIGVPNLNVKILGFLPGLTTPGGVTHQAIDDVALSTAEVLAEHAVGKRLIRLGVPNCYTHGASRNYLVSEYGFDKYSLIKAIEELCHKKLIIVDQEDAMGQTRVAVKELPVTHREGHVFKHSASRQSILTTFCTPTQLQCLNDPTPTDAATGLATKIMFIDFTQQLTDNGDSPLKTESDGNKFCIFLWKMLDASESGSIGGDACRFFDALYAAYQDIMKLNSTATKFEHLLGWTIAKEYGEYAENYTFNFIYKPRPKKAAPAPVEVAAAAVGKASPPSPSPTSVAHAPGVQQGGTGQPKVDEDDDDDEPKPWEMEGWVPRTKNGKQKSPNVIRGELQRYIDKCKADGTMTQTKIIETMGVNNNTYRRFMNPKTYKDQWSALQNGTYSSAARLLEEVKYSEAKAKKSAGSSAKRKAATSTTGEVAPASKKSKKDQATELINRISAVEGVSDGSAIYDSCPVVVAKIKEFLQRDGITKAMLLKALGDINSNSLNRFLSGKQQDQCGNVTYQKAYVFFEKLRIMEGKAKSTKRLSNEEQNPQGFSTTKARAGRWIKVLY